MHKGGGIVLAGLVGASAVASARDYDVRIVVDSVDDLYDLQEAGELSDDELDLLVSLFERPLDLNRADRYLLYDLPEVTYELADAMVRERALRGGFAAVDDLLQVPGFSPSIFESVRPFVSVDRAVLGGPDADIFGKARTAYLELRQAGADLRQEHIREGGGWGFYPMGFLHVEAGGYGYFAAGGLVTYRPLLAAAFDGARGELVVDGVASRPHLEALYLGGHYGMWRAVVGSFNAGFGERLIFDNTRREHPNGLDERVVLTIRRDDASLKPRSTLRGAAVSLESADLGDAGWVDATGFVSYAPQDLYQYDFWYGYSEDADDTCTPDLTCESQSTCRAGYVCGCDHRCHSSRVVDQDDPTLSYLYGTHDNAFNELIVGGNLRWSLSERAQVGATAYRSGVSFDLAEEAEPNFSYSAVYPREQSFGAAGVNAAFGHGPVDVAAEGGMTFAGGRAWVARVNYDPVSWAELGLSLRYYDRNFENPHSRAIAQRIETLGSTRRNTRGARFTATLRPLGGLKLVSLADLFEQMEAPSFDAAGDLIWIDRPVSYARLSERVVYALTARDEASVQVSYSNNDLEHNSRAEEYQDDDVVTLLSLSEQASADPGAYLLLGRGERRAVRAGVSSRRLPQTRLSAIYTVAWQDSEKFDDRFETEANLRLTLSSSPWPGGRVNVSYKQWLDAQVDNRYPLRSLIGSVRQRLGEHLQVWGAYGNYLIAREAGDDTIYLVFVGLEARL